MIRLAPYHPDIYLELDGNVLTVHVKGDEACIQLDHMHKALLASAMLMEAQNVQPIMKGSEDEETN